MQYVVREEAMFRRRTEWLEEADWGDADLHGECAGFPMICRTVRGLVSMALIRCRGLLLLTEGPGYLTWGCLGYDECVE